MKNKTIILDKAKFENVISALTGTLSFIITFFIIWNSFSKNRDTIAGNFILVIIVMVGILGMFLLGIWTIDYFIEKYLKVVLYEK
jgi:divalent metal cation (Fe/Co/Zn/Cd) transporter